MVYGLGGIGMSTMAGNALLMKALMSLRQKVSTGAIGVQEYKDSLKNASFASILHWNKPNPFTQNHAQFIDYANNPKVLAQRFGVKKALPLPISQKLVNILLRRVMAR